MALCLWAPIEAHAQDKEGAEEQLQQLEADIKAGEARKAELEAASRSAVSEAERLSRELVTLGRDIRLAEGNALRLERRVATLEAEEQRKKQALDSRQTELLELLSALERLSKRPAALAILQPREALDTARSASLMGTIVPDINTKAGALRRELASLAVIQRDLSAERFQLKNTLERLTEHQLKVGSLVRRRQAEARKAERDAAKVAQELQAFADQAASLKELIEELARQAAKKAQSATTIARPNRPLFRPQGRKMAQMKGALPFPVIGRVVHKFGAQEAVGEARGIKIETRPEAQVVAPFDGKIVFAGPFKNYGQLLIIEHGDGYHSLMAGFGELYGAVGQWVLTGEPVGIMAPARLLGPLYLELRANGAAVNPEPWLNRQLASSE